MIIEFHGSFRRQQIELEQWIREHKDSFFSDIDTGDHRTYGYYKNHVVFPLQDGRLVWVELIDRNYDMGYVVHEVEAGNVDKNSNEFQALKNIRGIK